MFGLLLLAMVQIIVEVLPISSSGHMRLAAMVADYVGYPLSELPLYCDELLHGFTLVAVLLYFRRLWVPVVVRLWEVVGVWRAGEALRDTQKKLLQLVLRLAGWVTVSTVITVVGYSIIKLSGVGDVLVAPLVLAVGFCITGIVLVICPLFLGSSSRRPSTGLRLSGSGVASDQKNDADVHSREEKVAMEKLAHPELVEIQDASPEWAKPDRARKSEAHCKTIVIALAQVAACLLPGVSRFAMTVFAAIALGTSPRRAVQWSWLIFVPLMLGASVIHGVGRCLLADGNWFVFAPGFFVGCMLATSISYVLFALVMRLFQRRQSWILGLYMLVPLLLLMLIS